MLGAYSITNVQTFMFERYWIVGIKVQEMHYALFSTNKKNIHQIVKLANGLASKVVYDFGKSQNEDETGVE